MPLSGCERRIANFGPATMTDPSDSVRDFYAALSRGDVAAVRALLHPQVQWTEAESFPYYSGTWEGPEAVINNLLIPLARDWEGFSARAHEFIAAGDRVVTLGVYTGTFKKTGRAIEVAFAHVWTVRQEKLARFDMYTDTAKVLQAVKV